MGSLSKECLSDPGIESSTSAREVDSGRTDGVVYSQGDLDRSRIAERFARYNPDIGSELRHQLWLVKERTGIPMTVHLRRALSIYLDVSAQLEEEELSDDERQMREAELALGRLRQILSQDANQRSDSRASRDQWLEKNANETKSLLP